MCHDIFLETRQITSSVNSPITSAIYNGGLPLLNDLLIAIGGRRLDDYSLSTSERNEYSCLNRLILRETSDNIHQLKQYIADNESLLNSYQANIYNFVFRNIYTHTSRIIYLDTPGAIGKTLLLNLLAKVKYNGDLPMAVVSSKIASTFLNFSTFKLPIIPKRTPTCELMPALKDPSLGRLSNRNTYLQHEVTPTD